MAAPKKNQGIYSITSPSKRIYIGQSVDIFSRFAKYRGMHCDGQPRLYNSFLKYGVENHKFELIEHCDNECTLNEKERFWQNKYKVTSKVGLNCKITGYGDKSGRLSNETREKIARSNTGKKASAAAKAKMSKSRMGRKMPEKQRLKMIGRKFSLKTRKKMSDRMKGNALTKGMPPVNCKQVINDKTGAVYYSLTEAAKKEVIKRTTLGAMLSGQNKNKTNMRYL